MALSKTAPAGHAAYELEDAAQPLADALGRLAPEDLGEPHVGVRERDGQVLAPCGHPADPEVGLADAGLDLSGQPAQLQEALGVPAVALAGHLLPALLHVALHGGIGALVAAPVDEPHIHPHGRMALLAPVHAVIAGPGVGRLPVRRGQLALRLLPLRRLGRQVLHPRVLPGRRLRDADCPRDRGYRLPAPRPSAHVLHPVHADHFLSGLLMPIAEATTCWTSFGMVGVPMPEPESFSCSDPKVPDAQIRNSEVIKHSSFGSSNDTISCGMVPSSSARWLAWSLPIVPGRGHAFLCGYPVFKSAKETVRHLIKARPLLSDLNCTM